MCEFGTREGHGGVSALDGVIERGNFPTIATMELRYRPVSVVRLMLLLLMVGGGKWAHVNCEGFKAGRFPPFGAGNSDALHSARVAKPKGFSILPMICIVSHLANVMVYWRRLNDFSIDCTHQMN